MALTIVLVDDDPLMHRMLVPRLEALDTRPPVSRVVTALTPEAALAAVAAAPDPVVVVSDFNLKAAMNGFELLGRVRDARPGALRVLFSGYSEEQLGALSDTTAVDAFLEKPLLIDELVAPIAKLIAKRFA